MDAVLHAAANTAEDFPQGVTGIAAAIGKNKFSLMHELAGTGTAKLGLVDAVKMVKRSRDWRILNAIAEECGGVFVPLPSMLPAADGTLADLGKLAGEFADLVKEVSRAAGDGEISDNEMERIEREWAQTVAAGQVLMGHLRAQRAPRIHHGSTTPLRVAA